MDKDKFLKEHPSLKNVEFDWRAVTVNSQEDKRIFNKKFNESMAEVMKQIHETQLDKQKVKDAINNHLKRMREEYRGLMEEIGMKSIVSRISIDLECELKEELGLE